MFNFLSRTLLINNCFYTKLVLLFSSFPNPILFPYLLLILIQGQLTSHPQNRSTTPTPCVAKTHSALQRSSVQISPTSPEIAVETIDSWRITLSQAHPPIQRFRVLPTVSLFTTKTRFAMSSSSKQLQNPSEPLSQSLIFCKRS